MTSRLPLPEHLANRPFRVAEAVRDGIALSRLGSRDVTAPFHGVRVPASMQIVDARSAARAYAPRLSPQQAFGSVTAAALWGLPLPPRLARQTRVHIVTPQSRARCLAKGVVSRRVADHRWSTVMLDGLRTADPLLTLAMLAPVLDLSELVTVMEALRSTAGHYPGLVSVRRPLVTAHDIAKSIVVAGAIAGVSKLRAAADLARDGVESPAESRLRWLIVQHGGLPEPEINVPVRSDSGEYLGKPDMSYRWAKVAIDYEGDHHRTDRGQWREDIRRGGRFTDNGWLLLRATGDDLGPNARSFVQRVAAGLARAPQPGAQLLDANTPPGPHPKLVSSSRSEA